MQFIASRSEKRLDETSKVNDFVFSDSICLTRVFKLMFLESALNFSWNYRNLSINTFCDFKQKVIFFAVSEKLKKEFVRQILLVLLE